MGRSVLRPYKRASVERLRLVRLRWRRSGSFGFGHELGEAGGVLHRDVRKDLAVQRDACSFEAVNQLSVRQAVVAGGGADALHPQAAVLALLDAAVALGVTVGAIGGFLRGLVELALGEEKTFCPLEVLLAPCPALGAAFYACHGFLLLDGKQDRLRTRVTRVAQRVCFRGDAFAAFAFRRAPSAEAERWRHKTAATFPRLKRADRPAGTLEGLPGTIFGACVPRFKHKGTNYFAPTKKNGWRAISPHAQKIDTALAVGKHLLDAGHVCFVHQRELLQLAHAGGRL